MIEISIEFDWYHYGETGNDHDNPGRWTVLVREDHGVDHLIDFLRTDLAYNPVYMERCLAWLHACRAGEDRTPSGFGGEGGTAYFGNGYVCVASRYLTDRQVLMPDDQFLLLIERVHQSMGHPDYRNGEQSVRAVHALGC